jgi:prephenate dehydratase/transposase-like protein
MSSIHRRQDGGSTGKRRRYTAEEKLEIIEVVRTRSFAIARERFGVSRTSIHEWRKQEADLLQLPPNSRRTLRTTRDALVVGEACNDITEPTEDSAANNIQISSDIENVFPEISRLDALTTDNTIDTPIMCPSAVPISSQPQVVLPCYPASHTKASRGTITIESIHEGDASRILLVGYNGEHGGFAEIAARRFFGAARAGSCSPTPKPCQLTGYPQAVHMLEALSEHEIDYAVLATETLFSTTFHAALNRVIVLRFSLVAEIKSEETVCLCGLLGAELRNADCVMSDWQLLARYEEYLLRMECMNNKNIHRQVSWDSATACRIIHEEHDQTTLVLCSQEAAQANGLVVLQARVPSNLSCTKYMVVARRGATALAYGSSLSLGTTSSSHRQSTVLIDITGQAALYDIISAFARLTLQIEHFTVHNHSDDPTWYVICQCNGVYV